MAWWRDSIILYYNCYGPMLNRNQSGRNIYIPLALYAYHTAVHTATGMSPYVLMFGRQPQMSVFETPRAFDPTTYQFHLHAKLAQLKDFVESKLVSSAAEQKMFHDQRACVRLFQVDDNVWLSLPRAGKLDPKWQGDWKVVSVKSFVNVEISNGTQRKVVHINRLQHCVQPTNTTKDSICTDDETWSPPQTEHFIESVLPQPRRNPPRNRRSPDYYIGHSLKTSFVEREAYVD